MMTIEAIFQNGVFRPLAAVPIPENRRVRITLDEGDVDPKMPPHYPRLSPSAYLEEFPEVPEPDHEYRPVPPKAVRTVPATVRFADKLEPDPYPEE